VHLVGFTVEIYYDARSYKRQNRSVYFSVCLGAGACLPGKRVFVDVDVCGA
jgi:hypothetical protein